MSWDTWPVILGQDANTHKDFYRLTHSTVPLSKISQMLLAVDKGELHSCSTIFPISQISALLCGARGRSSEAGDFSAVTVRERPSFAAVWTYTS